jgi:hypothetical protein
VSAAETLSSDLLKEWEVERIKRELQDCMLHERSTTGIDRRHWIERESIGENDE